MGRINIDLALFVFQIGIIAYLDLWRGINKLGRLLLNIGILGNLTVTLAMILKLGYPFAVHECETKIVEL